MGITLRDYQKEGMQKGLQVKNSLMCIKVGEGKTFISLFTLRKLMKDNEVKKGITFCTKTSVIPFIQDLAKLGIEAECIEDEDLFFEKLHDPKEKHIIAKHSMIKKIGYTMDNIDDFARYTKENPVFVTIDEAHKLQNPKGVEHTAWDNIRPYVSRSMLLTATPYSSELTQLYGLVSLIYPKLWSSESKFRNLYIDELIIRDRSGRTLKREIQRYKNLAHLRKTIEPFTYFYYPQVKLNFHNHVTRLEDYTEYDKLCEGVMED